MLLSDCIVLGQPKVRFILLAHDELAAFHVQFPRAQTSRLQGHVEALLTFLTSGLSFAFLSCIPKGSHPLAELSVFLEQGNRPDLQVVPATVAALDPVFGMERLSPGKGILPQSLHVISVIRVDASCHPACCISSGVWPVRSHHQFTAELVRPSWPILQKACELARVTAR